MFKYTQTTFTPPIICLGYFLIQNSFFYFLSSSYQKKSRIWETKHLSTDADSSTDTTVGCTKNSQKPNFFEKRKKSSQTQELKNVQRYAKISIMPFDQRSLFHQEAWFPPCFVRQNQQKKKQFFLRGYFRPLPNKHVQF